MPTFPLGKCPMNVVDEAANVELKQRRIQGQPRSLHMKRCFKDRDGRNMASNTEKNSEPATNDTEE
jgi:hypothetical protein